MTYIIAVLAVGFFGNFFIRKSKTKSTGRKILVLAGIAMIVLLVLSMS